MMRKFAAMALTALLLASVVMPVEAVGSGNVAVASAVIQGQTVSLTVSANAEDVRSVMIVPVFDGACLELLSGRWLIAGELQEDWSPETGDAVIAFEKPTDLDGAVLELTFRVLSNSDTQVSCEAVIQTNQGALDTAVAAGQVTACTHSYGKYVADGKVYWQECTQCGAKSEATAYTLGDVTGDGKVNMKDWLLLYDHISEVQTLNELQLLRGDVTLDGKANTKDWARLYNHLSEVDPL